MKKTTLFLIAIVVLVVPTFLGMLRPGIFSTQDFPFIRLMEFDRCVKDLQIPCRWSPDIGIFWGEPLFNFYSQLIYLLGEIIHLVGFSLIDSLKTVFIFSFVLSAISMFFLSRKIWKNNLAGLISGVVYVYAPYRAVDVWVRGNLAEAFSFVVFPLIILAFEGIIEKGRLRDYIFFGVSLAFLVLTHNLSIVLFLPFLAVWMVYRILHKKRWSVIPGLIFGGIWSFGLAAFYILPALGESKFVDLESTTRGYFDFRAHYVTVYQLLISRFWGYGGSTWGSGDGLSLAIGIVQWLLPLALVGIFVLSRKKGFWGTLLILTLVGWFYLFLAHNKSTFIWEVLSLMKYIQFPWRFLGQALFAFSIAVGAASLIFKKTLKRYLTAFTVIVLVMVLNYSSFRPDLWYSYKDSDLTTGDRFIEQTRASIGDYWPKSGSLIPKDPAPDSFKNQKLVYKKSNQVKYELLGLNSEVVFPINYFPGWQGYSDGKKLETFASNKGLVSVRNPGREVILRFEDTSIRKIGNYITIVSLFGFIFLFYKRKSYEK